MIRRCFSLVAFFALLGAAAPPPAPPAPNLSVAQRATLDRYLVAIGTGKYADAFRLLTVAERRYFASAANFASSFQADRLKIGRYKVLRVATAPQGVVAFVSEQVEFFDHAHQASATATARVAYGLFSEGGAVRVKDPSHPWRAIVPVNATAEVDGLRVTVRKVSFFTGRVEFLLTFANAGDNSVTLLPYGRSLLHDDGGAAYHLIETNLATLTDRNLRRGLLLAGSAQYTGALTFFTPDRFAPKSLDLTIGKELRDGADAPFEVVVPPIEVPQ
jgi:hypothetical protein